ncbi:MAG: hypothetical protein M3M94_01255 [Actinomycetota bacterium]|nr:hypothetical protein [Actinomycetota bacterium]
MRTTALAFPLAFAVVALAACGGDGGADREGVGTPRGTTNTGATPAEPSEEVAKVVVTLRPQGAQGQAGKATLLRASEGNTTMVRINFGKEAAGRQPAHVHEGTCEDLDPKPKFPLEDVKGGVSETRVPVPLQQLLEGEMAINVHRSAQRLEDYVACGEIVSSGG